MLQFLPWCALDRTYDLGDLKLVPFSDARFEPSFGSEERSMIRRLLAPYRGLDGRVVHRPAIVLYKGEDPLRDLSEEERRDAGEEVHLACFSSLAARRLFTETPSNSTCFTRYVQRFEGTSLGVTITARRPDGEHWISWPLQSLAMAIPPQASAVHQVSVDDALFAALVQFRSASSSKEWSAYQNAIDCFNVANRCDDAMPSHVEWVMLAAAFQRLLGSASKASAIASAFEAAITPEKPRTAITTRHLAEPARNWSIRKAWMYEFYTLRGDFAHGQLSNSRPTTWTGGEHVVLATIAFPLLVKGLLREGGYYEMRDSDWAQIDAFEDLLDSAFMKPPEDQASSWDWIWPRLQPEHMGVRSLRKFMGKFFPDDA
jgi:hypothetical protein